jgi:hypothetical protein
LEVSGQLHAPAALPPVPIGQKAWWAPEPAGKLLGSSNQGRYYERGMHEKCIQFHSENLKGRDYLDDLNVDGKKILKRILNKYNGKLYTGITSLRIGTSSEFI